VARFEWAEPDDVRDLADGEPISIAGLEITVDHAPGHTRGSVLFRLPGDGQAEPSCLSGDVLFAGSIGRTDLPGGDGVQMWESLRDRVLPLADETWRASRHGPAPRSARSARATPSCARSPRQNRVRRRAEAGEVSLMSRPTPLSGFPEWLPAEQLIEQQFLDRIRRTFELHGFTPIETRAVEPLDQLLRKGETSKEVYLLRRLQASDPSATSSSVSTSTSPCRSPATSWRTPASCTSRSVATRSRRCGGASGRRRVATGSSGRPTSTSSTATRSGCTTTTSCRSSRARRSPACPSRRW
jgi:hypothetical protein